MNLQSLINNIISIAFPEVCLICKTLINISNTLCDKCFSKLNFLTDNYCVSCGTILPNELSLCSKCIINPTPLTMLKSVFVYNIDSKNMILNLKFHDDTAYVKTYARWMYNKHYAIFNSVDIIIPIPLHRIRLFVRKYNQSVLLARHLSKLSKIPMELFACKRIKNTVPQFKLSTLKREHNIKGSFVVLNCDFIKDKTILLIDDVLTTGITLTTCAETLINCGAKEVRALTLARTIL